ncbi:MAG TPA: hypothetical protein VJ724_15040, partial [Tahibacter sp.]|nr:hypothetical protein [Tahibacter sp.]
QFGRFLLPGGFISDDASLAPGEERAFVLRFGVSTSAASATLAPDVQALAVQFPPVATHREARFVVNYDLVRDSGTDALAAASTFAANWTREFTDPSNHGCARSMCSHDTSAPGAYADMLDWRRTTHLGETAYVLGDVRLNFDAAIATAPFRASATEPVTITLRHAYDLVREPPPQPPAVPQITYGRADVQLSIDGGPWMPAGPFVASGEWSFLGTSGGWRNDTIVLHPIPTAGRLLRVRLYARAPSVFLADDAYWAISRVAISGATTPVFSTVHPDGS